MMQSIEQENFTGRMCTIMNLHACGGERSCGRRQRSSPHTQQSNLFPWQKRRMTISFTYLGFWDKAESLRLPLRIEHDKNKKGVIQKNMSGRRHMTTLSESVSDWALSLLRDSLSCCIYRDHQRHRKFRQPHPISITPNWVSSKIKPSFVSAISS